MRVSTLNYEGIIMENNVEWKKQNPSRARKRKGSYILMMERDEMELRTHLIRGPGRKAGHLAVEENAEDCERGSIRFKRQHCVL